MASEYRQLYELVFGSSSVPDKRALERLEIAVLDLPKRERRIIDAIYGLSDGEPLALGKVAKITPNLNQPPGVFVSVERVKQIRDKAAQMLRHPRYEIKYAPQTIMEAEKPLMDRSIYEFNFPVRIYNCLRNAGIKTIGELVERTAKDLLESRHFGRKSLQYLQERLEEHGMHLRDELIFKEETTMDEKVTMLIICSTTNGYALVESLNPEALRDPRLLRVFETKKSLLSWIEENLDEKKPEALPHD